MRIVECGVDEVSTWMSLWRCAVQKILFTQDHVCGHVLYDFNLNIYYRVRFLFKISFTLSCSCLILSLSICPSEY